MESRRFGVGPSCLVLVMIMVLTSFQFSSGANVKRKIGVQFLSFSYLFGQLQGGSCCDNAVQSGRTGGCVANACDTAFTFCITHRSNGSTCDPFFETTPLINNNTVNQFGRKIDPNVENSTSSLVVIPVSTMEAIHVGVGVKEVDENGTMPDIDIGNFTLVLNTTHLFTKTPVWSTFDFSNSVIKLSLNATSFCSPHYFGSYCNVSCRDSGKHYTCDKNGNKICHTGYEGVDCNTITDLCVSGPCHHGATCQKQVNNFTCTCAAGYTGKTCDTAVPTSTSVPPGLSQPTVTPKQTTSSSTRTTSYAPVVSKSSPGAGKSTVPSAQKSNTEPSSGGTNIAVILGPLAGLLLLGALATLLILWRQRKRKRTVKPEEEDEVKKSPEEDSNDAADIPMSSDKPLSKPVAPLATQNS